ncbi:MAG: NAD(P)/FAD-dependent oxidoreductase [Candidatus Hodarchaeota archaeon]
MNLKVAGAGIAGLSAAITATRLADVKVQVRDTANSIEKKISRGINALRNYDSKSDIIEEYQRLGFNFTGFHPIYKQIFLLNPDRFFEIESEEKPIFYTTERGTNSSIDNILLQQALSLNVEVEWNSSFNRPDILATGSKYNHCIGYGEHFVDVEDTSTIIILQNSKYCPFGYACILPYGKNEATVILGSFNPIQSSSVKRNYYRLIAEIPQFKEYIDDASVMHQLRGVGNFGLPDSAVNGSMMIVGERAGFLEAFRGFGIHNAIISGYSAGLACANGTNYDDLWKEKLSKSLMRGILRRIAENEQKLGSEQILTKLLEKIDKQVSLDKFRYELKKLEKSMLNNLDLPMLFKYLVEWNQKYPFSNVASNE